MTKPKQQTNNQLSVDIAVITEKVSNIEKKVTNIETKLESDFVTQDEFEPIKKVVFLMIGLILTAVVSALIALVVRVV